MKLIIDIPEELYKDIQSRDWKNGELVFSDEWKAIHNGIPLDNLRAEIEETYINITYQENKDRKATWGLRKALEIIDKYRNEVSHDI